MEKEHQSHSEIFKAYIVKFGIFFQLVVDPKEIWSEFYCHCYCEKKLHMGAAHTDNTFLKENPL